MATAQQRGQCGQPVAFDHAVELLLVGEGPTVTVVESGESAVPTEVIEATDQEQHSELPQEH